jgi:uncharacterized RDD family membrane protein YckC
MLPENPTFLVRGEDGVEYGPVDLAELREWVAENRAGIGTEVKHADPGSIWEPWQNFPELVALLAEVNVTEGEPELAGLVLAPIWRRALAFLLDFFLASLLTMPLNYVFELLSHTPNLQMRLLLAALQPDTPLPPEALFYGSLGNIVSLGILVLYFAGFHAAHGQTPGKQVLRVRVVNAESQRPTFVQTFWRAVILVLSINLFLLPMFYVFFNHQRRAIHDLIAGTYVVEA